MKKLLLSITVFLMIAMSLCSCSVLSFLEGFGSQPEAPISLDEIPDFDGKTPFVVINGGIPYFTADEMKSTSFEEYAELDSLGRCGVTVASVGIVGRLGLV